MKMWVGITDSDWFRLCSELNPDEVNFWQPSGEQNFRVLEPGGLFVFKLHSPDNFIVGGGFFVRFTFLPVRLAWEAFGTKNGVASMQELLERVKKYRRGELEPNPTIGCSILTEPFYFTRDQWIPAPESWGKSIVRGKAYDTSEADGKVLYEQVRERLVLRERYREVSIAKDLDELPRYGADYLTRARLGQGAFRVLVTDAYQRRCAITGERTLPTLDAAHIKPYSKEGPHRISNGMLLRSDWHRLYDEGYVTVTPDLRVEVSSRIRREFENGRDYYAHHGANLKIVPAELWERPSREYLDWHNQKMYRA